MLKNSERRTLLEFSARRFSTIFHYKHGYVHGSLAVVVILCWNARGSLPKACHIFSPRLMYYRYNLVALLLLLSSLCRQCCFAATHFQSPASKSCPTPNKFLQITVSSMLLISATPHNSHTLRVT